MQIPRGKRLDRRAFLRGLGGTAIALPVLDIMLGPHGEALANGRALTPRFFVGFNGQSLGADGDSEHNRYAPDTIGPNYDLKTATMPLGEYGDLRDEVAIISGLRIPYGTDPIPAGGWASGFHLQALSPLISGVRNPSADDHRVHGPTADQLVAEVIAGDTRFRSLQYQVQASWYLTESAPYGRDVLSYRRDGADLIAMPGQTSPRAAWQALFAGVLPDDDDGAAEAAYQLAKRRSILDTVGASMAELSPHLGAADRKRLERHLDEVRELERRLEELTPDTGACMVLPDPGEDPPIGGDNASVGGDDFDVNNGYSDEAARARVFSDLIHMAFVCDLTRSVSLTYTMAQSHMSIYPITAIPYDQHELGHGGGTTEDVSRVVAWHVDHFAYLVAKLRDTPEGGGRLLDRCAMVLLHEGGHGFDPASGNENSTHSTENMCCMVAGRVGGLSPGQHIRTDGAHPGQVLNTAMRAVGVDADLGEVSGTIAGLRT